MNDLVWVLSVFTLSLLAAGSFLKSIIAAAHRDDTYMYAEACQDFCSGESACFSGKDACPSPQMMRGGLVVLWIPVLHDGLELLGSGRMWK